MKDSRLTPTEAALKRIAEAAQAVAPGPWVCAGSRGDIIMDCKGWPQGLVTHVSGLGTSPERQAVRAHIAAFSPAVILALLATIEQQRQEIVQP